LGARPLKRVIQKEIQDKLSTIILDDKPITNNIIEIDFKDNEFTFTF